MNPPQTEELNYIRSSLRRGADKEGREGVDSRRSRPSRREGRLQSSWSRYVNMVY